MVYAFLLFWPANVISPWLFITLLQFFIPLNLFFKSCVLKLKYTRVHFIAGFLILAGVAINLVGLKNESVEKVRL